MRTVYYDSYYYFYSYSSYYYYYYDYYSSYYYHYDYYYYYNYFYSGHSCIGCAPSHPTTRQTCT